MAIVNDVLAGLFEATFQPVQTLSLVDNLVGLEAEALGSTSRILLSRKNRTRSRFQPVAPGQVLRSLGRYRPQKLPTTGIFNTTAMD